MALFDRLGVVRFGFRGHDRPAHMAARRWVAARQADPRLAEDLIVLGNVLCVQTQKITDGNPALQDPDPVRLAYEAGRRDMAVQLLSMMNLSSFELSKMMESNDVEIS